MQITLPLTASPTYSQHNTLNHNLSPHHVLVLECFYSTYFRHAISKQPYHAPTQSCEKLYRYFCYIGWVFRNNQQFGIQQHAASETTLKQTTQTSLLVCNRYGRFTVTAITRFALYLKGWGRLRGSSTKNLRFSSLTTLETDVGRHRVVFIFYGERCADKRKIVAFLPCVLGSLNWFFWLL